jgi:hypothetical protein
LSAAHVRLLFEQRNRDWQSFSLVARHACTDGITRQQTTCVVILKSEYSEKKCNFAQKIFQDLAALENRMHK